VDAAVDLAHRALDLGMAGVADHHDLAALRPHPLDLHMDLGHQRTGGVEHEQAARLRLAAHRLGHAVRGEDDRGARRHLLEPFDEHRTLGAQVGHHVRVVHDLVADVHRRAVHLQRPLDDLDRAIDAGAEAARLGEQHLHQSTPITRTANRSGIPASG